MATRDEQLQYLLDPQNLELDEKEYIEGVEKYNHVDDAYWYAEKFWPKVEEVLSSSEYPDVYQRYRALAMKCRWVAFQRIPDEQVIALFSNAITEFIQLSDVIEIETRLRGRMVSVMDYSQRNHIKQQWREAMLNNQEPFTQQPLIVNNENRENTFGVWLRYYLAEVGYELVDATRRQEFLTTNPAVRVLSEEEKGAFRKLIDVIEFTKRDSTKPEGIDETIVFRTDDGRFLVVKDGIAEEVDQRLLRLAEQIQQEEGKENASESSPLRSEFLGPDEEREQIKTELLQLSSQPVSLKDELTRALEQRNAHRAQAAMKLLANQRILLSTLAQLPFLVGSIQNELKQRFSPEVLLTFNNTFNDPVFLQMALRYLYESSLQLDERASSRYGAQIEALLVQTIGEQYRGLVIADEQSGRFFWSTIRQDRNRLSLG